MELTTNNMEVIMSNGAMNLPICINGEIKSTSSGQQVIEAYLSTLANANTRRLYKRSINEFFQCIYGDEYLTTDMLVVQPHHAMKFREEALEKLTKGEIKTSTFNAKIKGCKQFYDWLMGQTTFNGINGFAVFNINPFTTTKQLAENDAEGSEPLTPEEVLYMIENAEGDSLHTKERNILILEIAISTGIRSDALISIKPSNIKNICGDWVIDTIDKYSKRVIRPINNYYERLMAWYQADLRTRGFDNGTIFNLNSDYANVVIRNWAKRLEIGKKITFHSLRTTTAVQVYHIYDENLGRTKALLQHSDTKTTDKYLVKEKRVNRDAEDIVELMKSSTNDFEETIRNMDKEDLVKMLLSLDTTVKMNIMRKMSK